MRKILVLGKLPPPYFGPAVATKTILDSSLKYRYQLLHVDTRINSTIATMGAFKSSKIRNLFRVYSNFYKILKKEKPDLMLLPNAQTTTGFIKDSIFVILAAFFPIKILLQLRGSNWLNWFNNCSYITRVYIKKITALCSGVIVLGEKLRYLFKDFFQDDQIFVVPNGGNYTFKIDKKGNKDIHILFFANLIESKGIIDFVDSFNDLRNLNETIIGLMVGTWHNSEIKEIIEETINKNNLPIKTYPAASGEIKNKFFEEAHIFVFPPRAPEGHPSFF